MALYSRAPDTRMLRAMRERGIDARLSRDAGRYLCNASFYAVLERRSAGQAAQIIFIHIPLPRGNYPLCKEKRRNAAIRSHTTNSVRLRDAVIAAGATMFSRTSRMATKW